MNTMNLTTKQTQILKLAAHRGWAYQHDPYLDMGTRECPERSVQVLYRKGLVEWHPQASTHGSFSNKFKVTAAGTKLDLETKPAKPPLTLHPARPVEDVLCTLCGGTLAKGVTALWNQNGWRHKEGDCIVGR